MERPKLPVVSNVVTKRHPPPVRKLPPTSVPREAQRKHPSRPASLPTVMRRPSHKPTSMPAPNKTTNLQKSLPSPPVSFTDRSLPKKTFVPKPLKIGPRMKQGKLIGGCLASVTSMQVTSANDSILRTRTSRSSGGVMAASNRKQNVMVKVSTTGPRNPAIVRRKPPVNVGTAKTTRRVEVTETALAGSSTRNWRLTRTPPKPIAHSHTVNTASHVAWSPPPSPDLTSFPSQSWTIIVGADVKRIETPTTTCGDDVLSSKGDAPKLGVTGLFKDSYGCSQPVSSPTWSSSPTVVETPETPAKPIATYGTIEISTSTKEPSTEVLHMVRTATTISPPGNGNTSSMATVAKVMDRSQAPKVSDSGKETRTTLHRAIEIARTFFLPSQRSSQSATVGTNTSRVRELFVPSLDKDAKASKHPITRMEIEMLSVEKGGRRWDGRSPPGSPWVPRCDSDCHEAEDVQFRKPQSSPRHRDAWSGGGKWGGRVWGTVSSSSISLSAFFPFRSWISFCFCGFFSLPPSPSTAKSCAQPTLTRRLSCALWRVGSQFSKLLVPSSLRKPSTMLHRPLDIHDYRLYPRQFSHLYSAGTPLTENSLA
ncbi:hypothetical protein J3R82DRAFT_2997 [Butyriboletus roseoflavus]|nr:hypothetical protein J3R82DRAFT_2997 [Butyriboletus roseoflavus]